MLCETIRLVFVLNNKASAFPHEMFLVLATRTLFQQSKQLTCVPLQYCWCSLFAFTQTV